MLECVVTAVEGVTVDVGIVWRKDGSVVFTRDQPSSRPAQNGSVQYSDVLKIEGITGNDHDAVYQCETVINTVPPVIASKELTLVVSGNFSKIVTATSFTVLLIIIVWRPYKELREGRT